MSTGRSFPFNAVDEQEPIDFEDFSKYELDSWAEGNEEEEEGEERGERGKSTDEDSTEWNVVAKWSDEGESYHEGEEVGEAEELFSSTISSSEKLEEERPVIEDSVIPAEVSADREAIINRLKELQDELSELRRKNKMLELWIFRQMKKTQERITPSDLNKTIEQMEEVYKEALRAYKMQIDEISSQQAELKSEFEDYLKRMQTIREEEQQAFDAFLNREKEVAIDLVFEKTGKKITEKMMNGLMRRQTARRIVLARDRMRYVFLQHRLEDLKVRLRVAETLGEGMTTMDYEALHVANMGYKNRLDERDHELEKLRIKIAETVNGVAQYKEKEICIVEDIEYGKQNLNMCREASTNIRERVNRARLTLNDVRSTLNEKKLEAGLLVAKQELLEMEKMMKLKGLLKEKINELQREVQRYEVAKHKLQEEIGASRQH
ncbi:uncharacterized protein LOC117602633 [Osmia lignaria lignaria]|uniref:uncharacterized protein LOC117602633 n=1 Tax=Osmia lignaria lignaria TaxID=1437193 RepID=UPI001478C53E|nr:centrosomal protein of 290 kDa [Osmia lignaria]